jgi:GNAT superfamily N-acetyltransferase
MGPEIALADGTHIVTPSTSRRLLRPLYRLSRHWTLEDRSHVDNVSPKTISLDNWPADEFAVLAVENGTLVGFVTVAPRTHAVPIDARTGDTVPEDPGFVVTLLYVTPAYRRQGHASRLLESAASAVAVPLSDLGIEQPVKVSREMARRRGMKLGWSR